MKLKVDFTETIRPMGCVGTNNGPIGLYGDHTEAFKEMGVKFVRFHETHLPTCKCVEVPFVFRDFSADENDPANYYFAETDAVIKGAYDAGLEICYRIGMGSEVPKETQIFTFHSTDLKDYEKYARIAEHIVAHYNDGWANGFHFGVKYWEIMNESDVIAYWPMKKKLYVDFYSILANHLKKRFPDILIGPCFANPVRVMPNPVGKGTIPNFMEALMQFHEFARRYRLGEYPVDFFPIHTHTKELPELRDKLNRIFPFLRDYGLDKTELITTEFNGISIQRCPVHHIRAFFQMETMHSAVNVFSILIEFQRHGITKMAYYDADDRSHFCGLYNYDGTKRNHFYSLKGFTMLGQGGNEVYCDNGKSDNTAAMASYNGKDAYIAFTNLEAEPVDAEFEIEGLGKRKYEVLLFDETHRWDPVRRGTYSGRNVKLTLQPDTAAILHFTKR